MIPVYKRPFKNFVKKAHKPLQLAIEDEVEFVCEHPYAGEPKVGDLVGFFVQKFVFNRQQYLIAYRPPSADLVADQAGDSRRFHPAQPARPVRHRPPHPGAARMLIKIAEKHPDVLTEVEAS